MLLGAVRGMMAARGVRGPVGSFLFMNLRLLTDQTLENATQWTPWPALRARVGVGAVLVVVAARWRRTSA